MGWKISWLWTALAIAFNIHDWGFLSNLLGLWITFSPIFPLPNLLLGSPALPRTIYPISVCRLKPTAAHLASALLFIGHLITSILNFFFLILYDQTSLCPPNPVRWIKSCIFLRLKEWLGEVVHWINLNNLPLKATAS